MITINKKEEMEKYLVGGTYVIEDDVTININLDLKCRDLKCRDLKCRDLKCRDLECWDLKCRDLECWDLNYYVFDKSEVEERLQGLEPLKGVE